MKTEGELDESRLVEGLIIITIYWDKKYKSIISGLTGETTIFKRRGDLVPSFSNDSQVLPKMIQFVMDISGRFSFYYSIIFGGYSANCMTPTVCIDLMERITDWKGLWNQQCW